MENDKTFLSWLDRGLTDQKGHLPATEQSGLVVTELNFVVLYANPTDPVVFQLIVRN